MPMETRDYLTILGTAITLLLFLWKLSFDKDLAKVRETVSFLERRSERLNELWIFVKNSPTESKQISLPDNIFLSAGFQQIELIAYLVKRNAFDEETVYQYCWYLFTEPVKNSTIKNWYDSKRRYDASIYFNYEWLKNKWCDRVANEAIGNPPKE